MLRTPAVCLKVLVKNNIKDGFQMAEIGILSGEATKEYLHILEKHNGHVYCVDWFKGKNALRATFNKNINIERYKGVVTVLEGETHTVIPTIPDASLDLCYIDADHRYSMVKKDIELSLPKIKKGGIIAGDDFDKNHVGVTQAVYDCFGDKVQVIRNRTWWVQL